MIVALHRQTTRPSFKGGVSLPVKSPYFQRSDFEGEGSRQGYSPILVIMTTVNAIVVELYITPDPHPVVSFYDTSNNLIETVVLPMTMADVVSLGYNAAVVAAIATYASGASYSVQNIYWNVATAVPPAPSSYQTIVTQTGTSVPAVSGSLTPTSTYPSGTTFTWARTGAGVYTLTASTAVFNMSGKTGVFVAPLQNLNASIRAVVTSSTVITVTTAVQSVAILGLLGLTTTNTDALLSGTMVYVQTYN